MRTLHIDEATAWEVLDALTLINQADDDRDFLSGAECYAVVKAITILREALADIGNPISGQPAQQEPVCYKHGDEPKQGCAWCDKQPAQPQQEPVAYRSRWRNTEGQIITGWVAHTETTANPDPRLEIEPLYTSPPAQRKPLMDEQVNDLRQQYGVTSDGRGIKEFTYVRDFARAIEAAHGIKEQP